MSNIDEKIIFETTEFGYQNTRAKVVIVGITPGNSQLKGDRKGLDLREIKRKNAFAGSMRPHLINMLDYLRINRLLDIESCSSLWEEDFDKVDMTSLLKEATYELKKDGSKMMFKDVKKIAKSEKLTRMLEEGFVKDCSNYEYFVLYVACGPGVYDVLKKLKEEGKIDGFVAGIAHPSGANLGRILCYLGKTEPKDLSYQWCVDKSQEAKGFVTFLDIHKSHWDM